jgi:hypothetical protein
MWVMAAFDHARTPPEDFSSEKAAIEAMKRRAMQYLRHKGYTDSPLDID